MIRDISLTFAFILSLFLLSFCNKHHDDLKFTTSYNDFIELAVQKFGAEHGISLAVVKDDKIIFEKYLGYADVDQKKLVDENTCFYIASSTKSFTALSALILESKGKLDLSKTLAIYFPEINFDPSLQADRITLKDLIIHTSGLRNSAIVKSTAYTGIHNSKTLLEQLEQLTRANTNEPFGVYRYSNLGYNILSMIMERELGVSWKSIVEAEILTPLKMHRTSANMSTAKNNGWDIAKPHNQFGESGKLKRLSLEKKDNTMHAAGGMISNARDLGRWLIMELNNGSIDGEQLFDAKLIEKSISVQVEQDGRYMELNRFGYGYGWNLGTTANGDTLIHHFGGFVGAHAEVSMMPSIGLGVVIMANEANTGSFLSFLLASYAFDYFSGMKDVDTVYENKLDKILKRISERKERFKKHQEELAKREWQMELPFSNYAGTYANKLLGNLIIRDLGEQKLIAEIGNLQSSVATPYRKVNSIRVEMIPGSGSGIVFELENGKVQKAIWDGQPFVRILN